MEPKVCLVVYMDGDWKGYAPLSPEADYAAAPPDPQEIEDNVGHALEEMETKIEGKFVFGVHTGVYCRELLYGEPFMNLWKKLVAQGGELAIHPHEEVVRKGNLFQEKDHMEVVITSRWRDMAKEGLHPSAFRGGYSAYSNIVTPILERLGIGVDLSSMPGFENPLWGAFWKQAPLSAHYLCRTDYQHGGCHHPRSKILEIPMGCDGLGDDLTRNYLYNEASSLKKLRRVWSAILERGQRSGQTQFVHFFCHLHAMGEERLRNRCLDFLDYALNHGAMVKTPLEAKSLFDTLSVTHR